MASRSLASGTPMATRDGRTGGFADGGAGHRVSDDDGGRAGQGRGLLRRKRGEGRD